MHYIGIDVAKESHVAACRSEDGGRHGKPLSFDNTAGGFKSLLERLRELAVDRDDCIVAMEATGHYWIAPYEFLTDHGYKVAVVNPMLVKSFRDADGTRKAKTDDLDAFLIAEYARFKRLGPTATSPERADGLKHLTRYRAHLVKDRTSLKNKATAVMDRLFPEIAKATGGMGSATTKALMRKFATPSAIASTDIRTLTGVVEKASRGRHGRAKAEEVKALAKKSVGTRYAQDALAFELKHVVALVEHMDKEIGSLDEEIARRIDDGDAKLLLTIPGIGPSNAATIVAEMGDANNFDNEKKLIAFSGIDSSVSQSGKYESDKEHMSKRGSGYLRYALINASDVARQNDPYFGDYYDSLIARGKHHYVALSGVARKLCGVILAVLRERRPYEPRPSIQSQAKKTKRSPS